jgi:translation elongation factor EF-G
MANRVIRTFSMLGADGAGKTALVEALLRSADPKRASPEGSSSRLDAEPEEKKRNFTLSRRPSRRAAGSSTSWTARASALSSRRSSGPSK